MELLIRTFAWAVLVTGMIGKPLSGTRIQEGPGYYVNRGSTINLTCIVGENVSPPLGSLFWFHNDSSLDMESRQGIRITLESGPQPTSVLQIRDAAAEDGGKYTCRPKDDDSADIWVYVLEDGKDRTAENSSHNVSVEQKEIFPINDETSIDVYWHGACPTPLCADKSCVIGVPVGHQCPTCICDEASKENDLEASHEKNELEPVLEENEPHFSEISNNETQTLDNEIESSMVSKNYTEREYLSPEFEENTYQREYLEGEETSSLNKSTESEALKDQYPEREFEENTSQNEFLEGGEIWSPPKISLLNDEESTFKEAEFDNILPEDIDNSTLDAHELRRKRSGQLETDGIQSSQSQQQWNIYQQDQFIDDSEDSGENSERELEGNDEEFSEVKILSTKNAKGQKPLDELVELDDNELENVIWTSEVAGCPAPMCADSSCRIGIPPAHTCPTCVCKKRRRQP